MITNISQYLFDAANNFPEKIAFVDSNRSIKFYDLYIESSKVAHGLLKYANARKPILIFLPKKIECLVTFYGVILSGNFYSPIDTNMPQARIVKIFDELKPSVIVTDEKHYDIAKEFANDECEILLYESLQKLTPDLDRLRIVNEKIIDTDLLYVLFTSGSTGIPKGVMITERNVLDFCDWATEEFRFNEHTIFGNQTPFYFSMSIYDVFLTIKCAATTYIIPHEKFLAPVDLMHYLAENKINTLVWVPSALIIVSSMRALKSPYLNDLKLVLFGGETMPIKQLNRWMKEYANTRFVNIYGPTEVTDTCSSYEVNKMHEENELLPIGKPCKNKDIILLDENNNEILDDGIGEICVRGSGLSIGYYNNSKKTSEVFTQNPLNNTSNEIIYHTGDLAKRNNDGMLCYISRKDYQIKHMGYRIELGEIETNVSSIEGIEKCCVLYDTDKSKIILYYEGDINTNEIFDSMKKLLPEYMIPNIINKIDIMPINLNGKIDRQKLKDMIKE